MDLIILTTEEEGLIEMVETIVTIDLRTIEVVDIEEGITKEGGRTGMIEGGTKETIIMEEKGEITGGDELK